MKSTFLVAGLVLIGATSCTNSPQKEVHTDQNTEVTLEETQVLSEIETCFLYTNGEENKDSTFVSLQIDGDSVSGIMHWQPWQVDGAYGTISAIKNRDKIFGVYNYAIEGAEQSQEIAFKFIDGKLYQGAGELKDTFGDDVMLVFKDTSNITYEPAFKVIDCQLFEKY